MKSSRSALSTANSRGQKRTSNRSWREKGKCMNFFFSNPFRSVVRKRTGWTAGTPSHPAPGRAVLRTVAPARGNQFRTGPHTFLFTHTHSLWYSGNCKKEGGRERVEGGTVRKWSFRVDAPHQPPPTKHIPGHVAYQCRLYIKHSGLRLGMYKGRQWSRCKHAATVNAGRHFVEVSCRHFPRLSRKQRKS